MDNFKFSRIIIFFLLSIILLFLTFRIDIVFFDNKLFGISSMIIDSFFYNLLGSFIVVYYALLIASLVFALTPYHLFDKILVITGSLIAIYFAPALIEFYNINGITGGTHGQSINRFFKESGFVIELSVFFIAFFTSFICILYPFRRIIAGGVHGLFNTGVDKNYKDKNYTENNYTIKNTHDKKQKNTHEKYNLNTSNPDSSSRYSNIIKFEDTLTNDDLSRDRKSSQSPKTPWITKVVYEDNDRVEIPFSSRDRVRKFKLKDETLNTSYYEEVKTLSDMPLSDERSDINSNQMPIDKAKLEEYFSKTKELWRSQREQSEKTENFDNIPGRGESEYLIEINPKAINSSGTENEYNENDYNEEDVVDQLEDFEEPSSDAELIEEDLSDESYIDDDLIEAELIEENEYIDQYIDQYKEELEEEYEDDTDLYPAPIAPPKEILEAQKGYSYEEFKAEENESATILEATLLEFGIKAEVTQIIHGPVVTLYKLIPAPGIKLSRIETLSNNLALRLAAKSIRIIAPIPGEKCVGIEIPNRIREVVSFKEVVDSEAFTNSKYHIPVGLGKDIYGNIILIDVYKMPHILVAGATGSGKSVCVNVFISSILFSCSPDKVKLLLIDPKIVELKPYNDVPHLLTPVITDSKKAINALKYLVIEMERRYSVLDTLGARDIVEYNKLIDKNKLEDERLPFIVAVVDEFADLISVAGKEVEGLFARLTAKARAVGIHLLLATQRPSIDVITGLIKANVPTRIAFQVISLQDSRIILDQKGAEKLLGQGDMLYLSPTQPFTIRLQGAFLSKEEVDRITEHWKKVAKPDYIDIEAELNIFDDENDDSDDDADLNDPLFKEAIDIVYRSQKASASYLQRKLGIGYNRAARMVEEMERMGLVGPQRGSKPREIISNEIDPF